MKSPGDQQYRLEYPPPLPAYGGKSLRPRERQRSKTDNLEGSL